MGSKRNEEIEIEKHKIHVLNISAAKTGASADLAALDQISA